MKVEILEECLKETINGEHRTFCKEDVTNIPDNIGINWCQLGWAKDLSGDVKTEERVPGVSKVKVDNVLQK